jgi:vanillate O-demethylase ferredoxin subunit
MNAINKPETRLLSLLVRQIRFEAVGINSYELVDPDRELLPSWDAGSHLDIHLPGGIIRQYSLCGDPADHSRYVIAVLKEENGRGGSRLLHETLQVQNIVNVSPPRNNFGLVPAAKRYVLIGGGIGITPLKAMAHELAASGKEFSLHYCAKGPHYAAFREQLDAISKTAFHYDGGNPANGLDIASLLKTYDEGTHVYYCGPGGFMAACAAATAHWPKGSVHNEHFKTPVLPPATVPGEIAEPAVDNFTVQIASTGAIFDIPADRNIVDVLGDADITIETSCVSGLCGTCKVKFLDGTVDHRDFILSDEERQDHLTACVSRATSARLVLDL